MRFLGILILVVLFFALFGPRISAWLKRKAMERAENYLRNAMGMPPREKTGRKGAGKNESRNFGGNPYERDYQRTSRKSDKSRSSGPIIPKEYAEDVEFIETIDYSSHTQTKSDSTKTETYHESQITDVEWTEIKS